VDIQQSYKCFRSRPVLDPLFVVLNLQVASCCILSQVCMQRRIRLSGKAIAL
jgi:hypothetical protein